MSRQTIGEPHRPALLSQHSNELQPFVSSNNIGSNSCKTTHRTLPKFSANKLVKYTKKPSNLTGNWGASGRPDKKILDEFEISEDDEIRNMQADSRNFGRIQ
jgi:hypothetical protein